MPTTMARGADAGKKVEKKFLGGIEAELTTGSSW